MNPRLFVVLLIAFMFSFGASAQNRGTGMQGRVTDSVTGEPLPFVQVGFAGSVIGTTTDMDGRFSVSNTSGLTVLRFQMMGYDPVEITLEEGKIKKNASISMKPHTTMIQTVEITTSRRDRRRYRRRDNPAVELVREVIAHKERNRPEHFNRFSRQIYEKTTLALDDFHPDFENKRLWRKLNFVEKYLDLTPFDATQILTISMRETMMRETFRNKPRQRRTLIEAYRMEGLDEMLGQEGLDESIGAMFAATDIYDNDIELMLNHFVSPLSSTLAVTFYKYYITDTVDVDGTRCVELSFIPANKQSYGFTGQMYIALNSSYAVTKYTMSVSPHVNLNFVKDLTIVQTYRRSIADSTDTTNPSSVIYLPDRCDTYGRLYINKRVQKLYAHNVRIHYNHLIDDDAETLPDSLFTPLNNKADISRQNKMRRHVWNELRPIELSFKETMLDSLRYELARLPEFKILKKTGEILFTGYIPTKESRKESKWDIGPIYNFISHNNEEGWRIRFGGMSTAALNSRNFAEGYIAYGFRDKRPKFNATYIHSFNEKERHSHEAPFDFLSFTASYDIETPGLSFGSHDHDNIFMSSDIPHKIQYVAQTILRYRKEWDSHIGLDTWIALRRFEPAGTLQYLAYQSDGSLEEVSHFGEAEWMGKLSFTPNRNPEHQRPGNTNMLSLNRDAPTINITHRIGIMEGGFRYQRTDLSAEKRIWIGAFGHIDTKLKSGVVWNRAPYPRLFFPDGNDNLFLSPSAFNTMRPMEFIMDQYAAFFATYHLKGWILNRIPLINKLRLREVIGFNLLYGGLSAKNNPTLGGSTATGLYKLPEGVRPLGREPYMEFSIGIENILKFIRIDYVRRISYNEGMNAKDKGFIKLGFGFTL